MLETVCVGDKFEMLVAVFQHNVVDNLSSSSNTLKLSLTSKV